jgi:alkanesulfonate monooxygenase SsuD/methylene tetrahydromethanopterin reductase-like flavin-dependent oxidoreductase (luciferase family)
MVTTPHLRHPASTTLAVSALHDLTGGRAMCTIGSGGGVAAGIGQHAATLATTRAYFEMLRDLSRGLPAVWDGGKIPLLVEARPVPLFMSADGPKTLRAAGALADGVVISIGSATEPIAGKIAAVRDGAEGAGRDPGEIEIWAMSFCSVRDDHYEALADVSAFLAVIAGLGTLPPRALAAIPEDARPRVRAMQERYDPTQHTVVGGTNARLLQELDLVDFFAGGNAIAGTPWEVEDHLAHISELGISCLLVPLSGQADPPGTLQRMVTARDGSAR